MRKQADSNSKLLTLSLFIGLIAMAFSQHAISAPKVTENVSWAWCYNKNASPKQIHFFKDKSSITGKTSCEGGDIQFSINDSDRAMGSEAWLIDESLNAAGFPQHKKQPTIMKNADGKDYFVSLWNNFGQSNLILALQLDFKNNQAKQKCLIHSHAAETLSASFGRKSGKLFIQQRIPSDQRDPATKAYEQVPCDDN